MMAHLVFSAIILSSSLHVEPDTTAGIRGKALSMINGRPLAGVMISVPSAMRFVVSDSTGLFWLDGLPTGAQTVRISYEGRETQEYQFILSGGRTKRLAVLLDIDAFDLDPVIVEAQQNPSNWRSLAGFYERMQQFRGFGRFFTREDIDQIRPARISTLLTLEGIATRCLPWCLPTRFSRGILCAIPVDVNGMPLREDDYDHIAMSEVAAVEIYRSTPPYGLSFEPAVAPGSSLWMGGSFQSTGSCGLVAIWTR